MEKLYDGNSVLLKLVYYCNNKREVYFKRSDVTEYLISSNIFDIPNKQGFDGNLSYFGFDIKNDSDGKRILLLRGKRLNEKCLQGLLNIEKVGNYIKVIDDDPDVFFEIDKLIENKTIEAKAFEIRKSIISRYSLIESEERLFGNKKMYRKSDVFYVFPDIVNDCINNILLYEIVSNEKLENYNVQFIFPIYDSLGRYLDDKIISYSELGNIENDFEYFQYRSTDEMFSEYEIQEISNERIIRLINQLEYDLIGKDSTKKVLNNIRLNTSALRALAINRDRYKCALCNIKHPKLLICSHIKPWKTIMGPSVKTIF
jgi:hypothetical protein